MEERLLIALHRLKGYEYEWLRQLGDIDLLNIGTVEEAIEKVVSDRIHLARKLFEEAKSLPVETEAKKRNIISRCYYAQYHAVRAVFFHVHRRDNDDHRSLPVEMEKLMGAAFRKTLEEWRKKRNDADYSLYLDFDLDPAVLEVLEATKLLLQVCIEYLRKRGVRL